MAEIVGTLSTSKPRAADDRRTQEEATSAGTGSMGVWVSPTVWLEGRGKFEKSQEKAYGLSWSSAQKHLTGMDTNGFSSFSQDTRHQTPKGSARDVAAG